MKVQNYISLKKKEKKQMNLKKEKKSKAKLSMVKDRRKLANILLNKSLTDSEQNHYIKLYLETSYKE